MSAHASRNVWAASAASFFTDISSEMIHNVLPLYLAGVIGAPTLAIGFIEGGAGFIASMVKMVSGALSDRMRARKPLAVCGYALSALAKPFFALPAAWTGLAAVRWVERVGKGVRTAPRDALIADATLRSGRGVAFGLHRAADTAGAILGLLLAIAALHLSGDGAEGIRRETFQLLVWLSLGPAVLGVLSLALGAREKGVAAGPGRPPAGRGGLGRPFVLFLLVAGLFELGNSSDAFLILRARERGLGVVGILWVLVAFNLVYAVVSMPAGRLSDRLGRKRIMVLGWSLYAVVYLGFAVIGSSRGLLVLYLGYGAYQGLVTGTARALIADLVPVPARGTAYGLYGALLGTTAFPASLLAGFLWEGAGSWSGLGAAAPFYLGAATSFLAAVLLPVLVRSPGPAADDR
ncbi:MAG: MFS transporter [Acidobacteriota bacterium]